MIAKFLCGFLILLTPQVHAAVLLGTGFNSATSGRLIPSLNLGVGSDSFEMLLSSTGVSTKAYYHSAYKLSAHWVWNAGEFGFGRVQAGFGTAALYATRSFEDTGAEKQSKSDYVLGPSFFVRWFFWDPAFIAVDCLYGIVGPSNRYGDLVALNARDNVSFLIGIRL